MKNSSDESWNAAALQLWQEHAVLAQDEQRASTGCQVGEVVRYFTSSGCDNYNSIPQKI